MTSESSCRVLLSKDSVRWREVVVVDFLPDPADPNGAQKIITDLAWAGRYRMDEINFVTTGKSHETKSDRKRSHTSTENASLGTPHARRVYIHSDNVTAVAGFLKELGVKYRICD